MSPQKKVKQRVSGEDPILDAENEKFKLMSVDPAGAARDSAMKQRSSLDGENSKPMSSSLNEQRRTSHTGGHAKRISKHVDPNETVALERKQFVSQIMSDLNKKVEAITTMQKGTAAEPAQGDNPQVSNHKRDRSQVVMS